MVVGYINVSMIVTCLICYSRCERKLAGHFLDPVDDTQISEDEINKNKSVFRAFCGQMKISLENPICQQWDFSKESLPFCSSCKDTVSYISELTLQLQTIQTELQTSVENLKLKIEGSEGAMRDSLEHIAMSNNIDSRVPVFRQLLLSPRTSIATDSDDVQSKIKRGGIQSNNDLQDGASSNSEDEYSGSSSKRKEDNNSGDSDWAPEEGVSEDEMRQRSKRRNLTRPNSEENEDGSDDSDFEPEKRRRITSVKNSSVAADKRHAVKQTYRSIVELGNGIFSFGDHQFFENGNRFKCATCPNRDFSKKSGILIHIKNHHLGEKGSYVCRMCGLHCDSPSSLKTHETTHTDIRDCICVECGKGFKNSKNLRRHLKDTHKLDLKCICHKCSKRVETPEELEAHMNSAHSEESSLACANCGKVLSSSAMLKDHIELHKDEKYFRCYYCGTHYLKKENLKVHVLEQHNVQT